MNYQDSITFASQCFRKKKFHPTPWMTEFMRMDCEYTVMGLCVARHDLDGYMFQMLEVQYLNSIIRQGMSGILEIIFLLKTMLGSDIASYISGFLFTPRLPRYRQINDPDNRFAKIFAIEPFIPPGCDIPIVTTYVSESMRGGWMTSSIARTYTNERSVMFSETNGNGLPNYTVYKIQDHDKFIEFMFSTYNGRKRLAYINFGVMNIHDGSPGPFIVFPTTLDVLRTKFTSSLRNLIKKPT